MENTEDKILRFQFEPVPSKQTRPSYNDGSDQDQPETHHNRLSSQEWCNCQKCKKMPTGLECVCCYEIPENNAFHLKLVSANFYQIFIFSSNDSPSKTMKKDFYFV